MPGSEPVRLAVAQTAMRSDPRDSAGIRAGGRDVRRMMRKAREAGATLAHFPESAICVPDKHILSGGDPAETGPANWELVDWDALRLELTAIAELAGELGLWTVVGSTHRLTAPNRPHNSLYVFSDQGRLVTRYDERMLSNTKITYMYAPGTSPRTFTVGGLRFGLLLGMEVHFPELFLEQERLAVDCVLFSTHGPGVPPDDGTFAAEAQAHAATNSYWVSYAGPAWGVPSGVISPAGQWDGRCPEDGKPGLALVDLNSSRQNRARLWRRTARSGIYEPHFVQGDRRSDDLHVW